MIRIRGLGAVAFVLVAVVAVAGCSSAALVGQGSAVSPSGASPSGFPSTSSSATPSSLSPSSSSSAVPSLSPTATAPTTAAPAALVCPSRANPPFCYPLPTGFRDYSNLGGYGKGWMYKTLVSLGRHDLIEVLGSRVSSSTDGLDGSRLQQYYNRTLKSKVGRYEVRRAGTPKRVTVDGARAFAQQVVYTDGVHGDTFTVFRGRAIVSISCQSSAQAGRVTAACGGVLQHIRIT